MFCQFNSSGINRGAFDASLNNINKSNCKFLKSAFSALTNFFEQRAVEPLDLWPATRMSSDHFFGFLQTKCRTVWFEKGIKKKYFTWI